MPLFDNANPFAGSKKPEDKLACYYYNRLWNIAMSLYEWKGDLFEGPDATLNRDYLEFMLLSRGQACFIKDKQGKLRGLEATRIGLDCYNFPITLEAYNHMLGNLKGLNGVNAVWIRNNKFAMPVISTIRYYASQLAKVQMSLNVSLNNNRMAKVFMAENDLQAQNIRKMQDDISAGKDAVIIKGNIFENIMNKNGDTKIPVYSTPSEYLADKYLNDIRSIMDDFFFCFGVNTSGANMIKHERNLVDEVNSNNQQIIINKDYWLKPRQEACDIVNKIFGTNLSVELRQEVVDYGLRESELSEEQASDIHESEV